MLSLTLLLTLSQLPDLPPPLGFVGNVVLTDAPGGVSAADLPVRLSFPGCATPQVISLANLVGGAKDGLATLKVWLASQPDVEKRLFGRVGAFGEVIAVARKASLAPKRPAKTPAPLDGYRWAVRKVPAAVAWVENPAPTGPVAEHWFKNAEGKWAFATLVTPPRHEAKSCFPAASVIYFDAKGTVRARYDADFGGEVSARIFGDRDQCLDFTFDQAAQLFHATLRACKAP